MDCLDEWFVVFFCEHLACFLLMQSKVKNGINSEHTHTSTTSVRGFSMLHLHMQKKPNGHSHSCTSIRGASMSTNHLCRCKLKDKMRSQVLTIMKREKVEGKSTKKKCVL